MKIRKCITKGIRHWTNSGQSLTQPLWVFTYWSSKINHTSTVTVWKRKKVVLAGWSRLSYKDFLFVLKPCMTIYLRCFSSFLNLIILNLCIFSFNNSDSHGMPECRKSSDALGLPAVWMTCCVALAMVLDSLPWFTGYCWEWRNEHDEKQPG